MSFNSYFVRDDRLCGLVDKDKKDGATIFFSSLLTKNSWVDLRFVFLQKDKLLITVCFILQGRLNRKLVQTEIGILLKLRHPHIVSSL